MKTRITAAALALASTLALSATTPPMTEADWDALRTVSRLSPAKHLVLLHVANECAVVPNADKLLALLTVPMVAGVSSEAALSRLPQVSSEVCASLAKN